MGACCCKDNLEIAPMETANGDNSISRLSIDKDLSLSENVDSLVKETLEVIGAIVDDEPEPPTAMLELHHVTDKPKGWLQLVQSLIRIVPLEHAMGTSVIILLIDDSPLPSKECVLKVAEMIKFSKRSPKFERNLCVILGCLGEKLSGPSSVAVLSDDILEYLLNNLIETVHPDVLLFSIIALEKFAQKSENKITIKKKLEMFEENPLLRLEKHVNSIDCSLRQVGYCAQWSLDNYFLIENRKYSYESVDVSNINAMLNSKDVSEYLKISADGLEARCDAYSFESVRCTYQVTSGCWYYEVLIITQGVMQIGWATKHSNFLSHDGYGIGDDQHSVSFDGCRRLIWHNAKSTPYDLPIWKGGCVLGCLLDIDAKQIIFSLNGIAGRTITKIFGNDDDSGYFAAASFMSFQQCRFNFGSEPFLYPPTDRLCKTFDKHAYLNAADKIILPRHLYLDQLRKLSVREDSCTLCFDKKGIIRIEPCKHRGFCKYCTSQLQYCPMCRGEIISTVEEELDSPTPEDLIT